MIRTTAHPLPAVRQPVTAWSILRWVLYPLFPVSYLVAFVFRVLTRLIPAPPDRTQERYTGQFNGEVLTPFTNSVEDLRANGDTIMTCYNKQDGE